MNINKRKLVKWRKDALVILNSKNLENSVNCREQAARILDLTQELMDQVLLLEELGKSDGS